MYGTYALAGNQPMSTVRTLNYSPRNAGDVSAHNHSIISDPVKTDFGKIKGVEVLHFRNAELQRNSGGQSTFAAMGPLQVLYFPKYDRFVLSLNSWKYPLLKNIPIVSSSTTGGMPVTYTLPTVNGYFTLVISRVEYMESIYNLESIFEFSTKFSQADSEELMSHHNMLGNQNISFGTPLRQTYQSNNLQVPQTLPMNGNMMRHTHSPTNYNASHISQNFNNTFTVNQSAPTTASGKKKSGFWARIFRKSEYGRDKGERVGSSRHNLNMVQKRDINSMKLTTEVMAAVTYYPRREVERWILYNRDMASLMGFQSIDDGFDPVTGSPKQYETSSLNTSHLTDPSLPCNQPITSDRPIESITYQPGQNFTSSFRHDGKVKKAYIQGHSHSVHPDVAGRFNNLSRSEFQADRFKNMTNTSALYEATGISPVSRIEQPYSFTQEENNVILEDNKPSFTERVKNAITGHHEPETIRETHATTSVERIEEPRHVTFNQREVITSQPEVQTLHPTTQTTSILKSPRSQARTLESSLPSHTVPIETTQPVHITQQPITSTLPTLQERIRTIPPSTTTENPSLLQRVRGAFNKNEPTTTTTSGHIDNVANAHYAA